MVLPASWILTNSHEGQDVAEVKFRKKVFGEDGWEEADADGRRDAHVDACFVQLKFADQDWHHCKSDLNQNSTEIWCCSEKFKKRKPSASLCLIFVYFKQFLKTGKC